MPAALARPQIQTPDWSHTTPGLRWRKSVSRSPNKAFSLATGAAEHRLSDTTPLHVVKNQLETDALHAGRNDRAVQDRFQFSR